MTRATRPRSAGSRRRASAISYRRRAVAWSATRRPAAVTGTSTERRSVRARCRRTRPLCTSRSHIRSAADGAGHVDRTLRASGGPRHQRPVLRDRGLIRRRTWL